MLTLLFAFYLISLTKSTFFKWYVHPTESCNAQHCLSAHLSQVLAPQFMHRSVQQHLHLQALHFGIIKSQTLYRFGYLINWGHPRCSDLERNLGAIWFNSLGELRKRGSTLPEVTELSGRTKVNPQISNVQPTLLLYNFTSPHHRLGIPNSHPKGREVSLTPV